MIDRRPSVAPRRRRGTPGRPRLAGAGRVAAAFVGVIGTLTATAFLLVDHGVFGGGHGGTPPAATVLNVAARDLKAPALGGSAPSGESQLGNLVADAYRRAGGTHFAFVNSRGIRANIDAGEVTPGDLAAVLPFNNRLVRMELTGAQVWALLAQQFPNDQILQVSGLRFSYRVTARATGTIRAVEQLSAAEGPRPVPDDDSRRYTVVVDSFLADGGDGFSVLTAGTKRVTTTIGDVRALADYLGTLSSPFDSGVQGRIIRLG
jgi:2',3'-cyclic-nucleotide 2'-phosphodiesterase (5'-nucleotidase family)